MPFWRKSRYELICISIRLGGWMTSRSLPKLMRSVEVRSAMEITVWIGDAMSQSAAPEGAAVRQTYGRIRKRQRTGRARARPVPGASEARPLGENGLGMTPGEAALELERIKGMFLFLPETPAIYPAWEALVTQQRYRENLLTMRVSSLPCGCMVSPQS